MPSRASTSSGEPYFGAEPGCSGASAMRAAQREAADAAYGSAPGEQDAPATEPVWLNDRFAEIARRIEQSLAEIRPESSLLSLGQRFDQLEARMSSVLGGVATRADIQELRIAEAQIEDISAQLDQLRRQLARLDAIDSHLGTLSEQLSDDRLVRLLSQGTGPDATRMQAIDAQLRRISEQLSHDRLAELISENVARGTDFEGLADAAARKTTANVADRQAIEAQSRDLGEVRGLIESLIHERRHNDENNASMLETMQQAIIRVLDRIDALELAHQHGGAPIAAATAEPMQPQPEAGSFVPEGYGAQSQAEVERYTSEPHSAQAPEDTQYAESHYAESQYEAPRSSLFARERDEPESDARPQGPFATAPFDMEAAFARAASENGDSYRAPEPTAKVVDSLRHDFIADAHRAKLRAATKLESSGGLGQDRIGEIAATLDKKPRARRSFNIRSPRVLMSILTLLAMIPAAIFFMPRLPADISAGANAVKSALPVYEGNATRANASGSKASGPNAANSNGATDKDAAPALPSSNDAGPPAGEPPGKQSEKLNSEPPLGSDAYEDAGNPSDMGYSRMDTGAIPSRIALRSGAAATVRHLVETPQEEHLALLGSEPSHSTSPATPATPEELMQESVLRANGVPLGDADKPSALPPATVGPFSLRLAAARGDPSAQFEVAVRLAEGKGTDKDVKEALLWYQRSAGSGFAIAQFRLGTLYERGLGVKKDLARSQVWYTRAAEQGNVKAMHNLAVLIAARGGAETDYATAAKWFREAAARGLADSQFNLAVLYENGLGVKKDLKEAYKWLLLAARSGDAESKTRRDALKASLSDADRAAAEAMADSWRMTPTDPVANDFRAAGQAWSRAGVASRN